jgi:hypothetical protein
MSNWTPLKDVPQLAARLGGGAPATPGVPTVPGRQSHEIDFKIHGNEMQFVEVYLDPGESAIAEAGGMMFMTPAIKMETIFGDGSGKQQSGLMGALLGAGKRLLTGESLFMTVFTNAGAGVARVAFAAPYPGKILPMDLAKLGGTLICQKDSLLCAAKGSSCRSSRATAWCSPTPAGRCRPTTSRPARRFAWTRAAWSLCSHRSTTTSSSSAASRPRCSAARASFSPR